MRKVKRRPQKKKKSIKKVIYLSIILVMGIVISVYAVEIMKLKSEKEFIQKEQKVLKEEKALLENELEYMNSKDYIEQQARDQLKMVKPGEIMYIQKKEDESDKKE